MDSANFNNFVDNNNMEGYNHSHKYEYSTSASSGIKRGDIYYVDFSPTVGSEQGGVRPGLIIQNDMGNKHSPTVIVAAITSRQAKHPIPTHISLHSADCGLVVSSIVLLEQLKTIDKSRLKRKIGTVDSMTMRQIDSAIAISLGIGIPRAS